MGKPNSMCSHKINSTELIDIDNDVIDWIKIAYENAGYNHCPQHFV